MAMTGHSLPRTHPTPLDQPEGLNAINFTRKTFAPLARCQADRLTPRVGLDDENPAVTQTSSIETRCLRRLSNCP